MADAKITLSAEDKTKAAFAAVQGSLQGLQTKAIAVSGALGAIGVGTLALAIQSTINDWDELGKAAQRAGFESAQAMAENQFAARLAGVEAAGFEQAIGKLAGKMADAAGGNKEAAATFTALGIKVKSANGELRASEDVIADLAERFSNWKDGPEKSALAIDLFGKAGKALIPLLNGGKEGLEALRAEFRQLHGQLTGDMTRAAEQVNDNISRLQAASGGFARELTDRMLPGLVQVTDEMVRGAKEGGVLLGIWRGLKEFAAMAFGVDAVGQAKSKLAQTQAEAQRLSDTMDQLQAIMARDPENAAAKRRFDNLRKQLEAVQKDAFKASEALKQAIDPIGYNNDPSYWAKDAARFGAKPAAPIVKKPGSTAESEYSKINKELEKRLTLEREEMANGGKLSESRRFELEMLAKISGETSKLSGAEKVRLEGKVKEVATEIQANAQREKRLKWMQAEAAFIMQSEEEISAAVTADSKAREQLAAAITSEIGALEDSGKLLETEGRLIGSTDRERQIALEHLRIELKLRRDLWDLDHNKAFTDNEAAREIERQRLKNNAELAKQQATQRASIDEFINGWQTVDQTAHDVFVNIFEGGKTAFTKLRDTLKATLLDLLYQMTVKKWVMQIYASVTGSGGIAGAAQTAAGAMNAGSMLGGATSLLGGNFGSGIMSGLSAWGAEGSVMGLLSQGSSLFSGGLVNGLGTIAGALGPIAIGAMVLSKVFGSKGGPKSEAGYAPSGMDIAGLDIGGNLQGSQRGDVAAAQQISEGISASLDALSKQLNVALDKNVGVFWAMDPEGDSMTQLQVKTSTYSRSDRLGGIENVARGDDALKAAISEETTRVLFEALKGSDLAGVYREWLDQVAADAGVDEMTATIERISTASAQRQQLEAQIFDLTATDLEKLNKTRDAERAAIDESNRALLEQVYALQDQKAAIADWQNAYFASWAAIDKARESSLAQNDAFVSGMMSSLQDHWTGLFDGIKQQIKAIRGEWGQELSAANFQSAQTQYQQALQTIAGGGKGAVKAAESLPALAQQLLAQGAAQAGSRIELLTLQAATAQQLEDTLNPLRQLRTIQSIGLASAFNGSSVSPPSFRPTAVNSYGQSWGPVVEELRGVRRAVDRNTEVTMANMLKTHQVSVDTRELVNRGVQVLPAADGSVITTTT